MILRMKIRRSICRRGGEEKLFFLDKRGFRCYIAIIKKSKGREEKSTEGKPLQRIPRSMLRAEKGEASEHGLGAARPKPVGTAECRCRKLHGGQPADGKPGWKGAAGNAPAEPVPAVRLRRKRPLARHAAVGNPAKPPVVRTPGRRCCCGSRRGVFREDYAKIKWYRGRLLLPLSGKIKAGVFYAQRRPRYLRTAGARTMQERACAA